MVGGVISDIYRPEERNTPMALFSCTALFGIGTGAIASGFTAQYTTWRWIFYSQAIVDGVFVALLILLFPETRAPVLLRWKAAEFNALHEEMERAARLLTSLPATTTTTTTNPPPPPPPPTCIRWRSEQDEQQRNSSLAATIATSLTRPFHLLLTEPVAFFFSLWAAFAWATLYVALAAVPLVFSTTHNFTLAQSNAVFAAMCAGAVVIAPVSIYQERWARRRGFIPGAGAPPEARLYFSCVQSALLPAGLFLFGWTAGRGADVHWVVPALAVGVATMGIFSVYLAVFNYLSDTYGRFASSALAAQSFCRNGLGGVLTLVTRRMFVDMGYGPAGSCLGGIALALTLVPWVLVLYGERIRARSKFAGSL